MQQLQLTEVDEILLEKYESVNGIDTDIYTILAGESKGPLTNSQRITISSKITLNDDNYSLIMLVPLKNGNLAWNYTISNISGVFRPLEEIIVNITVNPDVKPFSIEKGTPLCSAIIIK